MSEKENKKDSHEESKTNNQEEITSGSSLSQFGRGTLDLKFSVF